MKRNRLFKFICLLLSLSISFCLCSCGDNIDSPYAEDAKKAIQRTINLRSEEEVLADGITPDDVITAFDQFLMDRETAMGLSNKSRFLALTGEPHYYDDDNGYHSFTSNIFEVHSDKYIENTAYTDSDDGTWHPSSGTSFEKEMSYAVISLKNTFRNPITLTVSDAQFSVPLTLLETVLSAFGGYMVERRFVTNDDVYDLMGEYPFIGGFWGGTDLIWICEPIDEKVIRNASNEQLEILYSFIKELKKIAIDSDTSAFTETDYLTTSLGGLGYDKCNVYSRDSSEHLLDNLKVSFKIEENLPVDIGFTKCENGFFGSAEEYYSYYEDKGILNYQYIYSYDDSGNVIGLTENTYGVDGTFVATKKIPPESLSNMMVEYDFSSSLERKRFTRKMNVLPTEVGYIDLKTNEVHFKCYEETYHPDGYTKLFGFEYIDYCGDKPYKQGFMFVMFHKNDNQYTYWGFEDQDTAYFNN